MVTYGKQKDSLEKMAKEIQVSKSLSEQQRVILKSYYNDVQQKSEMLYLKLTNDLLNSDKRKQIRNDIAGYVQSINGDFQAIKTSGEAFSGKYKEITGATRGVFVAWLIKSFALPLLESFVREIISEVARQQLDRHLKPLVVVKPWDSI